MLVADLVLRAVACEKSSQPDIYGLLKDCKCIKRGSFFDLASSYFCAQESYKTNRMFIKAFIKNRSKLK